MSFEISHLRYRRCDNCCGGYGRATGLFSCVLYFLTNSIYLIWYDIQATNVQLVSYSATIIRHISALLLISTPSGCMMMECTSYALDILFHISIHTDITGTRRMKKTLSESWVTNPFESQGIDR